MVVIAVVAAAAAVVVVMVVVVRVRVRVGFLLYRPDDAFLPPYLLGVSMLALF